MSTCPLGICDGSGFVLDEETNTAYDCECRSQRIGQIKASGLSTVIPRRYRGVSFERAPIAHIDPTAVAVVRDYINDLDRNLKTGRGLWFMGPNGTGKTSLAMLLAKCALEQGHSAAIYSLPRLLAEIRETYDRDGGPSYIGMLERLGAVDLLHIDDVGVEKTSEWVLEQLYSIVNARYEDERAITITTNLAPDELEQQIGTRTVSRLVEMCGDPLSLDGPDMRISAGAFTVDS